VRVKEAAIRLEVSSATVYGLVAAGKLKCHRVGLGRGAIRISEEHLVEFLKGAERVPRTVAPPTPARIVKLKHLRSN
jgi:excisionase family DNA binding protein